MLNPLEMKKQPWIIHFPRGSAYCVLNGFSPFEWLCHHLCPKNTPCLFCSISLEPISTLKKKIIFTYVSDTHLFEKVPGFAKFFPILLIITFNLKGMFEFSLNQYISCFKKRIKFQNIEMKKKLKICVILRNLPHLFIMMLFKK